MADSSDDDDDDDNNSEGERRKAEGIQRAADAQDEEDPHWAGLAFDAIHLTARMLEYFDADDVHELEVPEPRDPHAWGAPYQKARKAGIMEDAFDQPPRKSKRPSMHAARMPRYRSLVWDGY